ncbi:YojF family protein [Salisediminibacterium beveridgei]|uniref:DUF1806 domain-containing protein n=1 Tax=Salisediminibacterium beveridgei TaxID=632773 RepID=A0A1D7QR53_9BACI|nr:YojF family protein [Salisediminibacterium beveridgei]AOM81493.1 hypothetical protein BBEV_0098 [Salisediminibacterium beveridgei]
MKPIEPITIQRQLDLWIDTPLYVHLETTNGAYASHKNAGMLSAGAFFRNAEIRYERAKITGEGPYRAGLETEMGWLYAEGLTDWTMQDEDTMLLAGHDDVGKLAVSLQLSKHPFVK